ncbi:MAG: ligase-associated DNA damage response DEXH box helicase, partial [Chloroflexota bacterium]
MLHPKLDTWFSERGYTPFDFQREVWVAYTYRESGLIHAATGTGKTYAAWLGAVGAWLDAHPDETNWETYRTNRNAAPKLQVLWLTPMRALANDTANALRAPLVELDIPWTLETRTGDTSSSVRNRQSKRLPTALVTTPESLSLLLARANAHQLFGDLRLVVVDEWHELMASKRGTQTELCLARLRRWFPALQTWGLSATIGNLDTASVALLGVNAEGKPNPGRLVQGDIPKTVTIDSIIPAEMSRFPWAGHLGLRLLPQVIEKIDAAGSTLVFTNTRHQTEIWYQALLDARPDWAGLVALHHSALDRSTRSWVEDGLRDGSLKAVVCTSSLDLGVDFSPVEQVLQVGSPKGIARLLQRAGRSGHQPGAASRVTCVPTHAFELVETAAVREAAAQGHIEARPPIDNPLDVLVQHIVTIGLGGGFTPDDLYDEVRTAYAYKHLTREAWEWALLFVTQGGDALGAYDQYRKVVSDEDGIYRVPDRKIAQAHRMSIGTITSDAMLKVQYLKGPVIGTLPESFVSRLQPGDKFTLAGKVLTYVNIREMTVRVRRAKSKKGIIPRWLGGRLPLSDTLTEAILSQLASAEAGVFESDEMRALIPILQLQEVWSALPAPGRLLIERTKTRDGFHTFFYPFAGRLVHEGLAALTAYRLSQAAPITFTVVANDYGFELLSPDEPSLDDALPNLFRTEGLAEDIEASMNAAEMARRQFREIARVSGLVMERFPGGQRTSKQLQASAGLLYDVLSEH